MADTAPSFDAVRALVRSGAPATISAEARALSEAIRARHGATVLATLFYGSCLRPAGPTEVGPGGADQRLYDFYAIVADLRAANGSWLAAAANRLLPPNVYYIETQTGAGTARAKYAIVAIEQFAHAVSARHFHNYFWGRFAQPAAIVHAASAAICERLERAFAQAAVSLLGLAAPLVGPRFDSAGLWQGALAASYACELRPESAQRAEAIYHANAAHYDALTAPALLAAGVRFKRDQQAFVLDGGQGPAGARLAWLMRKILGKTLNVLRLFKAAFTFSGGVEYIVWKIERHSGIRPELTPWQRRHPILASPLLALRYWRKGAFR